MSSLLACLAGDGHVGHGILGRLLHQLITQVHEGRGAGPGVAWEEFTLAWDAADPVLSINAVATMWPATVVAYTLPRSVHGHARALRTAAAAVRRANVPSGT